MMRQGPNHRRPRGRNGGGRRQPTNRNQTFDSNGPNIRIRGNAFQVFEKYLALARDASSSGDRVMAENYFQHAEHYYRIINSTTDPHFGPRPAPVNGFRNGEDPGAQPQPVVPDMTLAPGEEDQPVEAPGDGSDQPAQG